MKTSTLKLTLYALILPIVFMSSSCKSNQETPSEETILTFSGNNISIEDFDSFLKSQMDSLKMPGLSIAVINDSKIVYHRTLGVSNIETQTKLNDKSLFDDASMSKTPFAYFTLKMVEEGLLDLDTPLYTYLPYEDIAHDDRYKLITARMVLCHTTGFPNWRFFNEDGKLDIKFTPGKGFQYSGEAYEYLANVIAHLKNIKKNDLQDLFEEKIGTPINMTKAFYTWNAELDENRVDGHTEKLEPHPGWGNRAEKPDFWSSYSMQSEAMSYANFLIALMNEKVLSKNSFEELFKVQAENPVEGHERYWGLGITIQPTPYGNLYGHGGDNWTFTSDFLFSKDSKTGYVFFTNSTLGDELNVSLKKLFLKKQSASLALK